MKPRKTKTETLASALDVLAREIKSGDGVANAAIAEAAERLRELNREVDKRAEPNPNGTIAAQLNWWKERCDELHNRVAAMPNASS
jgi:hypothetical protein